MANKIEVDSLLKHLHELEQLAGSVHEDNIPESFFSTSVDLIQKVFQSVYRIEQFRTAELERQLNEQRSYINEIKALLRVEEQKVKELNIEKEEKATVHVPVEPIAPPVPVITEAPVAQSASAPVPTPTPASTTMPTPSTAPTSVTTQTTAPVSTPMTTQVQAPKTQAEEKTIILKAMKNQKASLKEILERKNFTDLRKSFSLNDRFLFRKELFGGNDELMSRIIDDLNQQSSLQEALDYLRSKMNWDFKDRTVTEFMGHLERRFH